MKKILLFVLLFSGIVSAQWLSHTRAQLDSIHTNVYDDIKFYDDSIRIWKALNLGGDLGVKGDVINFINMPADSTGLATGDLWFNNSTGAIYRKF